MADKQLSEGKSIGALTIDVDCSDALKGLKAVQREARGATAALKELDDVKKHTCPECKTITLEIEAWWSDKETPHEVKWCTHCGWSNATQT
ncbi:hypothetical protein [Lentibacillus salicampi]|uniref:Uncharacterized protein n=1 Tax=Lentibacillus salicampi TaxID=175306 RepID=A0A4Y9A8I3_9BACI|nr:hypothetical protein [Lentibacillus salicampi]TFJ92148.1 hypothetical protein E4U82_13795 [Lentibacillus salicampi]